MKFIINLVQKIRNKNNGIKSMIILFVLLFIYLLNTFYFQHLENNVILTSNEQVEANGIYPFSIQDDKVFYNGYEVVDAKVNSFNVYDYINCHNEEFGSIHCFAYDEESVFYYSKKLDGASSDTFKFLELGYSKDADSVFYILDNNRNWYITNADVESFVVLGYAKLLIECSEVNPDTKSPCLSNGVYPYAKDKAHVYYDGRNIKNADSSTFILTIGSTEYDAQDKNYKYKDGHIIK